METAATIALILLAGLTACPAFGAGHPKAAADEMELRRVADRVLKQTTRRLVDSNSGRTFEDGQDPPVNPGIRIESKFNAWFYQTWLLADGMRRTSEVLNDAVYRDYGERNLDFLFRHMAFFERQQAAGMQMAPVGDGKLSPIGFYFKLDALWHTGLAPLVCERYAETKDPRYQPYLNRLKAFLGTAPRLEDGTFYRPGKGVMTDDPFMTVPFLVRDWKSTGDRKSLDSAIAQIRGTRQRLLDPASGLLRHLWDLKTQATAGVFWGRGNGWMVLAQVELLGAMPLDDPRRPQLLAAFASHMKGIQRCQDPSGGWYQVLDHPESWIESSCTGMFVYGLARGVNDGWLDKSFAESAIKGWDALKRKVRPDGDIADVCGSTDVGDLDYYLNRPRITGDLHGFGCFLLAGSAIIRM